jgi:PST family polysaccharide transporter
MSKMLTFFTLRPTFKNVFINTIGNYLNVFFTALFALILVRILSPSQYGVLSVLLGIAYVLANVLDFGTTATIYSYLPPLYEKKTDQLYRFIKSTFYYQSIFSVVVLGVLFITFPVLDKVFFKTGAPAGELYLTAFSVLLLIWQNFIMNIMFAAKKFLKANIYQNLSNVIKTLIIFFLSAAHMVSVGSVVFVFGIVGPAIFFLLLLWEKKDLVFVLAKAEVKREEFRFGYTLTNFIGSQFLNLGQRMDLFLLSYYQMKSAVGYYGLSQKIILTIITTTVSITQVLSPSFSRIERKRDLYKELKHGFYYLLLPSGLFLTLFLLPNEVFYVFFTSKFAETAAITKALSIPFILSAIGSLPLLFLLYTIKKPGYILWANLAFFMIITGGSYILIPVKGVFGPPLAIGLAFTINTLILVVASYIEYRQMPD